ncbi:MAG: VWA domain-containing protein [Burkholderiaceae bacterium]
MKIVLTPIKNGLCSRADELYVLLRAQSEPEEGLERTPLNLSLVLDKSGSMRGEKIEAAKQCAIDLIGKLYPTDQFSVVEYDEEIRVVQEMGAVGTNEREAVRRIQLIGTNGMTDLHGGWLKGSELLAPNSGKKSVCHVILLSDGQANKGIVGKTQICGHVQDMAAAGITTTTVGLGTDFNEELMTAMAKAGGGRSHYGERAVDLAETFESEMGLLTQLQWRFVQLYAQQSPTKVEMLNNYNLVDGAWRLPSIALGSECWALLKIKMRDAISLQESTGSAVQIKLVATDSSGVVHNLEAKLDPLPVLGLHDYEQLPIDELVVRRCNELRAAEIQLRIRTAALRRDWDQVEKIVQELEEIGKVEPWVESSLEFIRALMRERDSTRMSKEMLYKSSAMSSRLASIDEAQFSVNEEASEAAFLRRKMAQGRQTD